MRFICVNCGFTSDQDIPGCPVCLERSPRERVTFRQLYRQVRQCSTVTNQIETQALNLAAYSSQSDERAIARKDVRLRLNRLSQYICRLAYAEPIQWPDEFAEQNAGADWRQLFANESEKVFVAQLIPRADMIQAYLLSRFRFSFQERPLPMWKIAFARMAGEIGQCAHYLYHGINPAIAHLSAEEWLEETQALHKQLGIEPIVINAGH